MVTKRPIHSKALGEYFVSLRKRKDWTQRQAHEVAGRRDLPITYQALRGLEDGTTKNPDPGLLRAIATLYETSYEEVACTVVAARYGFLVHPGDGALDRAGGISEEALKFASVFDKLREAHHRGAIEALLLVFSRAEQFQAAGKKHKRHE